jgi:hypothetical protein
MVKTLARGGPGAGSMFCILLVPTRLDRCPRGFTGHVAHPSRSIGVAAIIPSAEARERFNRKRRGHFDIRGSLGDEEDAVFTTKGYAAHSAHEPLKPFSFDRRKPTPTDVQITGPVYLAVVFLSSRGRGLVSSLDCVLLGHVFALPRRAVKTRAFPVVNTCLGVNPHLAMASAGCGRVGRFLGRAPCRRWA